MFYIEQVSGSQSDKARKFFELRKSGASLDELKSFYSDATGGKQFPDWVTSTDDGWVLYNASSAIVTHYTMPKKAMDWFYTIWSEAQYEKWACMVSQRCGGEWKVVYEY